MHTRHRWAHRPRRAHEDYTDDFRLPGSGDQGHPPDFEFGEPAPGAGDQGHAPSFSQPGMPHPGAGDQGHPPAFHEHGAPGAPPAGSA